MDCEALGRGLVGRGFGVMGAVESTLDESNSDEYRNLSMRFRQAMRLRNCSGDDLACCGCNRLSLFQSVEQAVHPGGDGYRSAPNALQRKMLALAPGEESFFDELWPLSGWRPLSTYCSNVRYSFLMHEPVHRLISQLLLLCPRQNLTNTAAWSVAVLRYLYAHDLVLDGNDGGRGFPGTPAVSNFNTRVLLGPRVHFARLHALDQTHHDAAQELLARYDLVMPVRALQHPNASEIIARSLGWSHMPMVHGINKHATDRRHLQEAAILGEIGDVIREHNKWDVGALGLEPSTANMLLTTSVHDLAWQILTYTWVEKHFVHQVAKLAPRGAVDDSRDDSGTGALRNRQASNGPT
jgi:hypothetical protein